MWREAIYLHHQGFGLSLASALPRVPRAACLLGSLGPSRCQSEVLMPLSGSYASKRIGLSRVFTSSKASLAQIQDLRKGFLNSHGRSVL